MKFKLIIATVLLGIWGFAIHAYLEASPGHHAVIARKNAGGGSDPLADIKTDMVAWWSLEETGASDRVDAYGSNDLTATSTPGSGAGIINDAVDLEEGSSERLQMSDSGDFTHGGTNPITLNCWLNPESLTAGSGIWSQGTQIVVRTGTTTSEVEFILNSFSTNDRVTTSGAGISTGSW